MNPYSTHRPWSPEVRAAHASMPTNGQGHVVSLLYLEPREALRMEPLWRSWCQKTPRHLWPSWLNRWADHKRIHGWT